MSRCPPKKKTKTADQPVPTIGATKVSFTYLRETISSLYSALGDMHELYSVGLITNTSKPTKCRLLRDIITHALNVMRHLGLDGDDTTRNKAVHNCVRYPLKENKGVSLVDGNVHKVDVVFHGSVPLADKSRPAGHFLLPHSVLHITKLATSFSKDRLWDKWDTDRNLLYSLSKEVGELCEAIGWVTPGITTCEVGPSKVHEISTEAADVIIYALKMAHQLQVTQDLGTIGSEA